MWDGDIFNGDIFKCWLPLLTILCSPIIFAADQTGHLELESILNASPNSIFVDDFGVAIGSEEDMVRQDTQYQTAKRLGFQSGVRWRQEQINQRLAALSESLDKIFDFRALMLDSRGILQPPIIDWTDGSFKKFDDHSAQEDTALIRIRENAKIVTRPINWRSYLIRHYQVTEKVHPAVLPKDISEKAVWRRGALAGWQAGVRHADRLFGHNLAKLKADLLGMARYHVLVAQNIVLPPILAHSDFAEEHDHEKLEIGRRIYRITRLAKFNDAKSWKVVAGSKFWTLRVDHNLPARDFSDD